MPIVYGAPVYKNKLIPCLITYIFVLSRRDSALISQKEQVTDCDNNNVQMEQQTKGQRTAVVYTRTRIECTQIGL